MSTKTIAFLGATGGVGLAALRTCLDAGQTCIALCRDPSKLTAIFPPATTPNLTAVAGNAHDAAAVARCLEVAAPDGTRRLVDAVVSSIGGQFNFAKRTIDDPSVCAKGAAALLAALAQLRAAGVQGRPRVVVVSTTGISRFGRDVPLAMVPLYHVLLKVPHEDKRALEAAVVGSGEEFTIVRPSLLVDGAEGRLVRVGVEDADAGVEKKAVGYTISRADTGVWIAENLVLAGEARYARKAVGVTY